MGKLRYDAASLFPCQRGRRRSFFCLILIRNTLNCRKERQPWAQRLAPPPKEKNVTSVSLPTFLTRWVHCSPPPAAQAVTSSRPTVLRCFLRGPENGLLCRSLTKAAVTHDITPRLHAPRVQPCKQPKPERTLRALEWFKKKKVPVR